MQAMKFCSEQHSKLNGNDCVKNQSSANYDFAKGNSFTAMSVMFVSTQIKTAYSEKSISLFAILQNMPILELE